MNDTGKHGRITGVSPVIGQLTEYADGYAEITYRVAHVPSHLKGTKLDGTKTVRLRRWFLNIRRLLGARP